MNAHAPFVPMMQIGAVAERVGLSIRTLRHYHDVDLVRPSGRSEGGFRLYTESDVERLLLIRRMKPLGFSLEEMGQLLTTADEHRVRPTGDTSAALREFLEVASARRRELLEQVGKADEFIDQLRSLGGDLSIDGQA